MATSSAIAKMSVGRTGYGTAHASYITRMTALDPEGREKAGAGVEERLDSPSLVAHDTANPDEPAVNETLDTNLNNPSLDHGKEHGGRETRDVDPLWTWNAPEFLAGDRCGTRAEFSKPTVPERVTLKDKVENVRAYFGSLEDYERRRGGRTHYRVILSFDIPATNLQIKDLTNTFLEQVFPKAIAFGAIHRDTEHPHVHLYLNSRQTDGRRIQLKNNEFKTIDEKWAGIYSDFAGDRSVYIEHLRKKEETKQWKISAAEAYRRGEKIPLKPERDNDRRERLSEQRLSAERSNDRDRRKAVDSRPQAEPVSRASSERETSRLLARFEVAQEQVAHLIRTDAPEAETKSGSKLLYDLTAALKKTVAEREQMGRENLPQVVYTTEEWKQLKEYRASRELPVIDDRAAGRLQASCVMAGAEMRLAHEKAKDFEVSAHLWRFEVEGWGRKLSLVDIDKAIKAKTEEKLKLHNFLWPSRREAIQSQISYLHDVMKDIQKQLAATERNIEKNCGAAEARYNIVTKQVNQAEHARSIQGKSMSRPIHEKGELLRIDEIVVKTQDASLLRYQYDQIKEKVLANPSPSALSRVRGAEIMARMEQFVEADRLEKTIRYGGLRQLPLRDSRGVLYTRSIGDGAPRNPLETLIRHFTDSAEQRREQKALTDTLAKQVARAEERADRASDYASALGMILADHCRAAGISLPREIKPSLNAQQIAELRAFADKEPFLSYRRPEFEHAARQAEELLQAREAAAACQAEQARANDLATRSRGQSQPQERTRSDHPDRDSYSRGR